jgi:hypothetical protein
MSRLDAPTVLNCLLLAGPILVHGGITRAICTGDDFAVAHQEIFTAAETKGNQLAA